MTAEFTDHFVARRAPARDKAPPTIAPATADPKGTQAELSVEPNGIYAISIVKISEIIMDLTVR